MSSARFFYNSKLAFITFVLAFIVIMLGAYTRLTDAGLSCPDWPHCYGFITAPHTNTQLAEAAKIFPDTPVNVKKAWTEMTHRYFAGFEGILILILACSLLKNHFKLRLIGLALIGILGIQVCLGMLTVTAKLKPVIVLSHLLIGLSILGLLWWTYLQSTVGNKQQFRNSYPYLKFFLVVGLCLVISQISLGGWVSTHYAGLACIDFPYCNGNLLPTIQWQHLNHDLISIHMLHRLGAIVVGIYILLLGYYLQRYAALRTTAKLMMGLVCLQIILGILNILWLRPVWLALMHHGIAILLLLTVIYVLFKLYAKPLNQ